MSLEHLGGFMNKQHILDSFLYRSTISIVSFSMMISVAMFTGCEDEVVVEDNSTQEIVEKVPTAQENLKEIKSTFAMITSNETVELIQKSTLSAEQKSNLVYNMAGVLGVYETNERSVLADPCVESWAAYLGDFSADAYASAQQCTDGVRGGLQALAVLKGATSPLVAEWDAQTKPKKGETVEPRTWTADEALELLAAGKNDPSLVEIAKNVSSWSGMFALAQWHVRSGNKDEAKSLLQQAQTANSSLSLYFAGKELALVADAGTIPTIAKELLTKASEQGDAATAYLVCDILSKYYLKQGKPSSIWTDVSAALSAEHKVKIPKANWEHVLLAKIAAMSGELSVGNQLITKAMEQAQGPALPMVIWYGGWYAQQLEQVGQLKKIAEKAPTSEWIQALSTVANYKRLTTLPDISTWGVDEQYLAALALTPVSDIAVTTMIPKVLQQNLSPIQQIQLQLIQDDYLRAQGGGNSNLDTLIKTYEAYPHIQTELAIRKRLYVGGGAIEIAENASEYEQLWSYISKGGFQKTTSTEKPLQALANWSIFREALTTSKSLQGLMDTIWKNAPLHRVGVLRSGTVLDFSQADNLVSTITPLVGQTDDTMSSAGVGLIEMQRSVRMNAQQAFGGYSRIALLADNDKISLLSASAKVRTAIAEYHMGADFPVAQMTALLDVEKNILDNVKHNHLYPNTTFDSLGMRESFSKNVVSVISVLDIQDTYYAAVVSPNVSGVYNLGNKKALLAKLTAHKKILENDIAKNKIDPIPGDALRESLIFPMKEELSGIGNYLFIVPSEFTAFGFQTLPEQKDGLRFLADTRKITFATSLDAAWSASNTYTDYELEMFAMSRSGTEGTWMSSVTDKDKMTILANQEFSTEIGSVKIHYSGNLAKVLTGAEATIDSFLKNAPKARYIYMSEIPTGPNGGFMLADGELTLSQIASLSMQNMLVFISPDKNPSVQAARVEAFMQGGSQAVVVQSWALPTNDLYKQLDNTFIALKRNDQLLVALDKTRKKYVADINEKMKSMDDYKNNPASWGAWTVFGQP